MQRDPRVKKKKKKMFKLDGGESRPPLLASPENPRAPLLDPPESIKDDMKVYISLYLIICLYISIFDQFL